MTVPEGDRDNVRGTVSEALAGPRPHGFRISTEGRPLKLLFRLARRRILQPCAALAALLALSVYVPAPAGAAYMILGGGIRPKDFSLVKQGGYYHLFYIRNNTALPAEQTETDFGHSVSTDLYHWTQLPNALGVDLGEWDNAHLWAPFVFQHDGLWWMFYTGVSDWPGEFERTQRMGVAVSSDLSRWQHYEPVLDASMTSWAWWNQLDPGPAFRDPFVMPDPAAPGHWLMYYTASYGADTAATVVGVAGSDGDLLQWHDVKPLLITWRAYTYNQLTESPHVFEHAGLWYLLLTSSAGQPLSLYTSPDPIADPGQWTYRGRLSAMLGFDTSTWFASEYFRDGTREYLCFVNGDRIEIRQIQWSGSWSFSLVQPPLLHVVNMDWVSPNVPSGEQATLKTVMTNPLSGQLDFETLVVDSSGVETPVPPESLGFKRSPQVWSDTSYVVWIARRWPRVPDDDTTTVSRFRFRCSDQTAASGILTVSAPRPAAPPDTANPNLPGMPTPPDPDGWMARGSLMRALSGTPLGPGPALSIDLPAAARARVDLYDLGGRRVRTLADRVLPAGVTVLRWDGRDEAGTALPKGLYFARLTAAGRVARTRLPLLPR